jgi:hypothetical protein
MLHCTRKRLITRSIMKQNVANFRKKRWRFSMAFAIVLVCDFGGIDPSRHFDTNLYFIPLDFLASRKFEGIVASRWTGRQLRDAIADFEGLGFECHASSSAATCRLRYWSNWYIVPILQKSWVAGFTARNGYIIHASGGISSNTGLPSIFPRR